MPRRAEHGEGARCSGHFGSVGRNSADPVGRTNSGSVRPRMPHVTLLRTRRGLRGGSCGEAGGAGGARGAARRGAARRLAQRTRAALSGQPAGSWARRRRGARGMRRGVVTSRWRRPWLAQGPLLQSVNYAGLAPAAERSEARGRGGAGLRRPNCSTLRARARGPGQLSRRGAPGRRVPL